MVPFLSLATKATNQRKALNSQSRTTASPSSLRTRCPQTLQVDLASFARTPEYVLYVPTRYLLASCLGTQGCKCRRNKVELSITLHSTMYREGSFPIKACYSTSDSASPLPSSAPHLPPFGRHSPSQAFQAAAPVIPCHACHPSLGEKAPKNYLTQSRYKHKGATTSLFLSSSLRLPPQHHKINQRQLLVTNRQASPQPHCI